MDRNRRQIKPRVNSTKAKYKLTEMTKINDDESENKLNPFDT
jgi:hypothetical protein